MSEVRADTAQYSCKIAGQLFQVLNLAVNEEVSGLFQIRLSLWSENPEVDIKSMLRATGEITISWAGKQKQYFGIVSSFSQTSAGQPGKGGTEDIHGEYSCEVVPTLWLLGLQANCRIFQNLGADAIIKKVLDDRGMAGKYDARMSGKPTREYCVQYRETDLAFISRLMEEEGIFYYFTHDGKEMMVLGDSSGHYGTCAPESSVEYRSASGELSTAQEYLTSLTYDANAYTGKVKYKDFDYRGPRKPLLVDKTAEKNTDLEVYDYQVERYLDDGRGRELAKVAVDALALMRENLAGSGSWRSASAGCKFTLSKAYRSDLAREWMIVSAHHVATQLGDTGVRATSSFVAIPSDVDYRPPQNHLKPFLSVQTATVVGPKGEKIYMDDQGRAKVQFHWDLEGSKDENSSCWVRVAQPYAGMDEATSKKHGFQWHPLIGDEVVVDFLDGDPDNPLITGSVYNAVNTPIVKPAEHVRNRILTPYQHQLLMDDKNANVQMNTGGGQKLLLQDLEKQPERIAKGKVVLTTAKQETITMEDLSDDFGNMIRLETKDGHFIILSEKDDKRGIGLKTNHGNFLNLLDSVDRIELETVSGHKAIFCDRDKRILIKTSVGHKIEMDDKQQRILIESVAKGKFEINDAQMFIQMATPKGQSMKLDYSGTGLILTTPKGNIDLKAPAGKIRITGKSVLINSTTDVTIKCNKLNAKATSKASLRAATIEEKASAKHTIDTAVLKQKGSATATLEAMKITIKGTMVTSEANAVNMLKGMLVKIN